MSPELSPDQIERFNAEGYLTGLRLCSAEEMATLRRAFAPALGEGVQREQGTLHRHLDLRAVYDLCSHPAIVERVASLLGPDLLMWHSRFFDKPPGEPPVPWHQDAPFWRLEPMVCISAWVAIDAAGLHNGCVEVIPGSHRKQLQHTASEGTGRFGMRAEPPKADVAKALPIELGPGQFFLFDRWLVHRSPVNRSNAPRVGLSVRFTTPAVRVDCGRLAARTRGYGVQLVRGADRFGYNPAAPRLLRWRKGSDRS